MDSTSCQPPSTTGLVVPALVANPTAVEMRKRGLAGHYHFGPTRPQARQSMLQPLVSADVREEDREPTEYTDSPHLQYLNTWGVQTFRAEEREAVESEHRLCRAGHRFYYSPIFLADARNMVYIPMFNDITEEQEIGVIWIGVCPSTGTAINIQFGHRAYRFAAPLIGNIYEVATFSARSDWFVTILIHTPQSADLLVAKFCLNNKYEIHVKVQHLVASTTTATNPMQPVPSPNSVSKKPYVDGGIEFIRLSGSHEEDYQRLYHKMAVMINSWPKKPILLTGGRVYLSFLDQEPREITRTFAQGGKVFLFEGPVTDSIADAKERMPRINRVLKSRLKRGKCCKADTPYWSAPFHRPASTKDFFFPPYWKPIIQVYRLFKFTNRVKWFSGQDPQNSVPARLNLHQHYHRLTGAYQSNVWPVLEQADLVQLPQVQWNPPFEADLIIRVPPPCPEGHKLEDKLCRPPPRWDDDGRALPGALADPILPVRSFRSTSRRSTDVSRSPHAIRTQTGPLVVHDLSEDGPSDDVHMVPTPLHPDSPGQQSVIQLEQIKECLLSTTSSLRTGLSISIVSDLITNLKPYFASEVEQIRKDNREAIALLKREMETAHKERLHEMMTYLKDQFLELQNLMKQCSAAGTNELKNELVEKFKEMEKGLSGQLATLYHAYSPTRKDDKDLDWDMTEIPSEGVSDMPSSATSLQRRSPLSSSSSFGTGPFNMQQPDSTGLTTSVSAVALNLLTDESPAVSPPRRSSQSGPLDTPKL